MLAVAQQLSPVDRRRLDSHLTSCPSCSEFYFDMASLAGTLATLEGPTSQPEPHSAWSMPGQRESGTPAHLFSSRSPLRLPAVAAAVAASIAFFALGAGVAPLLQHPDGAPAFALAKAPPSPIPSQLASPARTPPDLTDGEEAEKRDFQHLQEESKTTRWQLFRLREKLAARTAAVEDREAEIARLTQESSTQVGLIARTRNELDQVRNAYFEDEKLIASRDALLHQLRDVAPPAPHDSIARVSSDDSSNLVSRRNLHVVDIYDNNAKGKPVSAFGRVLYSEGGPMLFFAFDLPNQGAAAKLTYHAWGQTEGPMKKPVQLGTFVEDDVKARRWMMKVSDPKLFQQLDAVYITADCRPEVESPGGPPMLYTYLRQLPNHP